MRILCLILLFFVSGCASPEKGEMASSDLLMSPAFQGRLGFPLGTYLTIEGEPAIKGKVGDRTLLVDTVNGQTIEPATGIWIDNLKKGLPKGERCIFRGYESGRMIGLPDEVAQAEGLQSSQACWQFYRYFIVSSVVKPSSLDLE